MNMAKEQLTSSHHKGKSLTDRYKHRGMRQHLVKKLRAKGIVDEKVLEAIGKVPRHVFVDRVFENHIYNDKPFSIGSNQTISHPYTVAFQTQLLQVSAGDKILEIGTGSGYQACILAFMGAKVYSIERQKSLYDFTSTLLSKIGFSQVRTLFGDGYKGSPRFAPYDKIIVTCGATEIPNQLLDQLAIGGKMVIPIGFESQQEMSLITRVSKNKFTKDKYGFFSFVPFLKGINEE